MGRRGSQDTPMRRRGYPQRTTRCPPLRRPYLSGLEPWVVAVQDGGHAGHVCGSRCRPVQSHSRARIRKLRVARVAQQINRPQIHARGHHRQPAAVLRKDGLTQVTRPAILRIHRTHRHASRNRVVKFSKSRRQVDHNVGVGARSVCKLSRSLLSWAHGGGGPSAVSAECSRERRTGA